MIGPVPGMPAVPHVPGMPHGDRHGRHGWSGGVAGVVGVLIAVGPSAVLACAAWPSWSLWLLACGVCLSCGWGRGDPRDSSCRVPQPAWPACSGFVVRVRVHVGFVFLARWWLFVAGCRRRGWCRCCGWAGCSALGAFSGSSSAERNQMPEGSGGVGVAVGVGVEEWSAGGAAEPVPLALVVAVETGFLRLRLDDGGAGHHRALGHARPGSERSGAGRVSAAALQSRWRCRSGSAGCVRSSGVPSGWVDDGGGQAFTGSRAGSVRRTPVVLVSCARALKLRRRRLLLTTNTLEKAIAAPASIGLSSPSAASGIAAVL